MKRNSSNAIVQTLTQSGVGFVSSCGTTDTRQRVFNDLNWLAVGFCIMHFVRALTRDEDRTIHAPHRPAPDVEVGLRRRWVAPTEPTGLCRHPGLRIPQGVARTVEARPRTVPPVVIPSRRESEPPQQQSEREQAGYEGFALVELAQLPERTVLDKKRLARLLSVTVRTVSNMAERGELPPPVEFAGRKVWLSGMVLSHIERRATEAAEKASRERKRIQKLRNGKLN